MLFQVFARSYTADRPGAAISSGMLLLILVVALFLIVAMWRTFERAGEPGWASLVPIYNLYIMTRIAGLSGWWVVAAFIPIANIVFWFVISIGIARRFNRSAGFGVGLVLLPFIFYPILAWGDDRVSAGAK